MWSDEELEILRVANNLEQLAKDVRAAVRAGEIRRVSAAAEAARTYAQRLQVSYQAASRRMSK